MEKRRKEFIPVSRARINEPFDSGAADLAWTERSEANLSLNPELMSLIPLGSDFVLLLLSSVISSLHVNIAGNIMHALGNAVLPPQSLKHEPETDLR